MNPTHHATTKNKVTPPRASNLELYRIVVMLLIVAHHYVVNSGLLDVIMAQPTSWRSLSYLWFGLWGKTGINCFMMITGYFMCKSDITMQKLVKLLAQIYLYKIVFFTIFFCIGYEHLDVTRILQLLSPVWGFNTNFVGCFILFFLTIPFWNILIRHMSQRQHLYLMVLLVTAFSVLPTYPSFTVTNNYVVWFGVIYVVASYIRLYPIPLFHNTKLWGWLTLGLILIALLSTWLLAHRYAPVTTQLASGQIYMLTTYLVYESNTVLAFGIGITSFLFFKNLTLPYIKAINIVGASTFGVLLIHANSNAMRQWLWKDTVDCVGHIDCIPWLLYPLMTVLAIFTLCIAIDRLRIRWVEKPLMKLLCLKRI